jgi:hypothetical protein
MQGTHVAAGLPRAEAGWVPERVTKFGRNERGHPPGRRTRQVCG